MKALRFRFLACGLAAALTLSGCDTVKAVATAGYDVVTGQSIAQVAPTTLADAEKALTLAHNAVNYVSLELIYNANTPPQGGSGLLHGQAAADAKVIYDKAVAYLAIADKADAVANTQGILDAVGSAQDLVTQFNALGAANNITPPPGVTPPATH